MEERRGVTKAPTITPEKKLLHSVRDVDAEKLYNISQNMMHKYPTSNQAFRRGAMTWNVLAQSSSAAEHSWARVVEAW